MSLGNCPSCGVSFKGAPIPDEYFIHDKTTAAHQWSVEWSTKRNDFRTKNGEPWCSCLPYGDLPEDERFYSTIMGIELAYDHPKHYDGVSYWQCQSCGFTWDRWTGEAVDPSTLVA